MEEIIRKEIRRILRESSMQSGVSAYTASGGAKKFPYKDTDNFVGLPEDIETKEDYLVNWEDISENDDLYGFPMQEFVKGIYVEKAKRNIFGILDIAEIVINNLKENHQFYSNLGV